MAKSCLLGLLISVTGVIFVSSPSSGLNLKPIIGILSQELSGSMNRSLEAGHNYTSYIAASYVKFIESGGARVIPIMINREDDYYRDLIKKINGVVFPGGAVSITQSSGYGRAGRLLYDLLLEEGKKSNIIPLMSICLGFEMMMLLAANDTYPLTQCKAKNRADPLHYQPGWTESELLSEMPYDVNQTLTNSNSTSNFHKYCVTPETFRNLSLNESFLMASTSFDDNGTEYISTVEHRSLPFYGFQWHPEKNLFEWKYSSIPHNREAIRSSQYIVNFFVDKARQNNQKFSNETEEHNSLIYNYSPTYTDRLYSSSFQQCYIFTNSTPPKTLGLVDD